MRQKRQIWLFGILIFATVVFTTQAQVTIGGVYPPAPGALLDLKQDNVLGANSNKGLVMPRVYLTVEGDLNDVLKDEDRTGDYKDDHTGLLVYNVSEEAPFCPGLYVWNNVKWVRLHGECTFETDPSTLPRGTGTFLGKRCFDIATGNDYTNGCGTILPIAASGNAQRAPLRTDFADRTAQDPALNKNVTGQYDYPLTGTGVQVYTFTTVGTVSNVRFTYKDPSRNVILSNNDVVPAADYSGNNISGDCKVTVSYNTALNNDLAGITHANTVKVDLYAIYNDAADGTGEDKAVKLTTNFQDCACCGARTYDYGWIDFKCHNLGATESADPFTPDLAALNGDYYQWGNLAPDLIGASTNDTAWGDGTQALNQPKGPNDPCPDGWKVPSMLQFAAMYEDGVKANSLLHITITSDYPEYSPNTIIAYPNSGWTPDSNTGLLIGTALFFSPAGYYNGSVRIDNGVGGDYWSSDLQSASIGQSLWFSGNSANTNLPQREREKMLSIRCVME